MTHDELNTFKREVADEKVKELLANAKLPENACYIHHLEIIFYDGRSCGYDNRVTAKGRRVTSAGIEEHIEEYSFSAYDVDLKEFFTQHKDCVFESGGTLRIEDEITEMDIRTVMRNIGRCVSVVPQLMPVRANLILANIADAPEILQLMSEQHQAVPPVGGHVPPRNWATFDKPDCYRAENSYERYPLCKGNGSAACEECCLDIVTLKQ